MYGTMKSADDIHYYALDVDSTAEMLVSLTSNANSSENLKFEVTDPSGNVILNSRHYKGEIFSLATGLGVSKGLYTVKIYMEESKTEWVDVDYELFWLYHETYETSEISQLFLEFEPNNTPEYANYIPDMSTYISSISDKSDVDYYKYTLAAKSEYSAILSTDTPGSVLSAEVFDSNNKSVGKFSFDDDENAEIFEQTLSAGTYYIKVSVKDTKWDNGTYLITGLFIP